MWHVWHIWRGSWLVLVVFLWHIPHSIFQWPGLFTHTKNLHCGFPQDFIAGPILGILYAREGAITTSLLITLNFSRHQHPLSFIRRFLSSVSTTLSQVTEVSYLGREVSADRSTPCHRSWSFALSAASSFCRQDAPSLKTVPAPRPHAVVADGGNPVSATWWKTIPPSRFAGWRGWQLTILSRVGEYRWLGLTKWIEF